MAAAVATRGAGFTAISLILDAIATALLGISLAAAKLRCQVKFTITGAVPMTIVERIALATT